MAMVLVIDDSLLTRTLASIALRGSQHRLLVARDGFEALELIEVHRPACLVLNRCTPGVSTEEILDRLRGMRAPTRVIIRGTALTERSIGEYRARGVAVVLNGPHSDEQRTLAEAIRSCTDTSQSYSKAG